MKFTEKIENYWYHYKWHTIIGIFALVVTVICCAQCALRREYDAMIMYAGNFRVANEYKENSLESIMKEDYNGDGEKNVSLFQLILNIEEKDGEYEYFDGVSQIEELQRLEIEIVSGDSAIYILHPYIYEQYRHLMRPLSDIFGTIPPVALDEYGIELKSLPAYRETTLMYYPENYILCMRNKRVENTLIAKADSDGYYSGNEAYFKDLVEY